MSCMKFITGDSLIHRLDPRVKIVVAAVFSVFIALSHQLTVLVACVFLAGIVTGIARLPGAAVARRLMGLNFFMLLLWLMLPVTTEGLPLCRIGPFQVSDEGIMLALAITLKGNSIVLIYTALLSTNEITHLGHALSHLRIPDKLAHLFLFTIRYVDVIHHEYEQLGRAMKVRSFRPGTNVHTYRTFGNLAAMLLARSMIRSERIVAAMKCRGFNGKFYVMDHFSAKRIDAIFGAASCIALLCLTVMEWL